MQMYLLPQFPFLFRILRLGCLDWQILFKMFFQWPNVYYTHTSFSNFFHFFITLCAFEAGITPSLHKYYCSLQHWPLVHSLIFLIFSIEGISKFYKNITVVSESFMRFFKLVTSTSVSPAQSAIISRTKPILGFGAAVKSILLGTISSRVDAKWQW